MDRSLLATIASVQIEYEDHGLLTIFMSMEYEGGSSAQGCGGYSYGNSKSAPDPAFGKTIKALCDMYGSVNGAIGQKVEVIKEGTGFNSRLLGFRPLFLKGNHPDFIFKDFFNK